MRHGLQSGTSSAGESKGIIFTGLRDPKHIRGTSSSEHKPLSLPKAPQLRGFDLSAVVPQLSRAAAFLRLRVRATGVSRAYCETPTTIDSSPQAARATTGARDNNGYELRSTGPWRNRTQTVQREESCHKGWSQRFHAQIVEELAPVVNHMWDSGCGGESAHSLIDPALASKSR